MMRKYHNDDAENSENIEMRSFINDAGAES